MPRAALAALLALPGAAAAHGFGRLYNLPVPFWLYAWAAAAVLVLSFLLAVWFLTGRSATTPAPHEVQASELEGRAHGLPRSLGLALFALTLATGFFGSRDPYRNFSMTFFWVVFVLGYSYATALLGNSWPALNPWRTMSDALTRLWRGFGRGRVAYPAALGDLPALALFLGFIWFELFGLGRPVPLARLLTAYTLLNLVGVWLIGSRAWFAHGEFFSVFFRLLGQMGARQPGRWQWPFARLAVARPGHWSTVVFLLAMLSTTAFDGLKATQWWVHLFWFDTTGWLTPLFGARPLMLYAELRPLYIR
jgi:hypothetical protein